MIGRNRFCFTMMAAGAALLLANTPARADSMTWLIDDLNDQPITATLVAGTNDFSMGCDQTEDYCFTDYARGADIVSVLTPVGAATNANTWYVTQVLDAMNTPIAAIHTMWRSADQSFTSNYFSNDAQDGGASGFFNCIVDPSMCGDDAAAGGWVWTTPIYASGTVQLMSSVQWSDDTLDTYNFETNDGPSAVPEPASLLLLGTGLLAGKQPPVA